MSDNLNREDFLRKLQEMDEIQKRNMESLEKLIQPIKELEQQAITAFSKSPTMPADFFKSFNQVLEEAAQDLMKYCSLSDYMRRLLNE